MPTSPVATQQCMNLRTPSLTVPVSLHSRQETVLWPVVGRPQNR